MLLVRQARTDVLPTGRSRRWDLTGTHRPPCRVPTTLPEGRGSTPFHPSFSALPHVGTRLAIGRPVVGVRRPGSLGDTLGWISPYSDCAATGLPGARHRVPRAVHVGEPAEESS